MSNLTAAERETLLQIARRAISRRAQGESAPALELESLTPRLQQTGASFVTLTLAGRLRGCIGSLTGRRPLAQDVQENALAAAFHDPRFPPLRAAELATLTLEISVLSAPQPLSHNSPEKLTTKLRPGIDGVVLQRGIQRATYLPQVWEQLSEPREFLAHLCAKAGLPRDAWRQPGIEISTYQVEKFNLVKTSEVSGKSFEDTS